MDSARSGSPDHLDDLDRGRAPYNRIVDKDDALTVEIGPARIVLQPHPEMADLIGRLDESPSDIMIADDPQVERQPRFLGMPERRRDTRIGNGGEDVRVDVGLGGELDAT